MTARRALMQENLKWPLALTPLPREQWPAVIPDGLVATWRSRYFFVQKYEEKNGVIRLTVCTTHPDGDAKQMIDGIGWDELDSIKRELGFGDFYAVEIYPRDHDRVNVCNMRHLWILPAPLEVGWFRT